MKLTTVIFSALAVAFACAASSAQAQLIAADSYVGGVGDYTQGFGQSFTGQGSASAFGFTDPWGGSTSGNTHPDIITLDNPAIDYETGGKGKFTPSTAFSDFERRYEHTLAPYVAPANDIFYMSHLVNTGPEASGGDTEGYALVGFGSFADKTRLADDANFLFGGFVGFAPDGNGDVDLVIRSRTGPGGAGQVTDAILQDASAGDPVENLTFHVVMKLTYTGGDKIDWWVNPTDFSSDAGMTGSCGPNPCGACMAGFTNAGSRIRRGRAAEHRTVGLAAAALAGKDGGAAARVAAHLAPAAASAGVPLAGVPVAGGRAGIEGRCAGVGHALRAEAQT
ncbi:MAG: hypothetical protein AAGA92_15295, partial [Planctomycetota bacterium]